MFTVLGILLLVAGAILTFAVDRQAEGVDLEAIGWILMAGGALSLLVAMLQGARLMTAGRGRTHAERHVSADGRVVVDDVETQ